MTGKFQFSVCNDKWLSLEDGRKKNSSSIIVKQLYIAYLYFETVAKFCKWCSKKNSFYKDLERCCNTVETILKLSYCKANMFVATRSGSWLVMGYIGLLTLELLRLT